MGFVNHIYRPGCKKNGLVVVRASKMATICRANLTCYEREKGPLQNTGTLKREGSMRCDGSMCSHDVQCKYPPHAHPFPHAHTWTSAGGVRTHLESNWLRRKLLASKPTTNGSSTPCIQLLQGGLEAVGGVVCPAPSPTPSQTLQHDGRIEKNCQKKRCALGG